jgi:hypothetical protein
MEKREAKKTYKAPELKKWGTVRDLTKGGVGEWRRHHYHNFRVRHIGFSSGGSFN